MHVDLPWPVLYALGGIVALLALSSIIVTVLARTHPDEDYTELRLRIRTWWYILAGFFIAVAFSRTVAFVALGLVSFVAFKEFLSIVPTRRADHTVLLCAYLAIPFQYTWAGMGWYGMFTVFIPVYVFLCLAMRMVLSGETHGFLRSIGVLHWGLMTTVYCLSYMAYLLALRHPPEAVYNGASLLFFLVFLTELNDVAQYVWGKLLGRRQVLPKVSPKKTCEGLLGGVATTVLVGWLIAPWFTPLAGGQRVAAGMLIGTAGFAGDVVISAVKRDMGIKDSGTMLPGHGGVLDRLDSLTFTAPLFFHFIYYLYY